MCRVIMNLRGYVFKMLHIVPSAKQVVVAMILFIYLLNSYMQSFSCLNSLVVMRNSLVRPFYLWKVL